MIPTYQNKIKFNLKHNLEPKFNILLIYHSLQYPMCNIQYAIFNMQCNLFDVIITLIYILEFIFISMNYNLPIIFMIYIFTPTKFIFL